MITWQDNTKLTQDEWVFGKLKTIGASETGAICIGSPYTSSIEIFYHKIGVYKPPVTNIRAFLGLQTEDVSETVWKYYSGTDESVAINNKSGNQIKDCYNKKATCFNSKYPHLSATPDRIIKPFGIYAGRGEGSLEFKNTQSFILKQYSPGLPPENVFQLVTQNMMANFKYGELFYFKDNRSFESHLMERKDSKKVEQIILERTIPFWQNVLLARPLYNQLFEAKRVFNFKLAAELEQEIVKLEPPIQYSDGYLKFINENYKSRASLGGKEAAAAEVEKAKRYRDLGEKINKLEKEKQQMEIDLKVAMKDATILNLGKNGQVSWQQYENRKIFKVNYKD